MNEALQNLSQTRNIWKIIDSKHISDRKRNAGASANITRSKSKFSKEELKFIKTNVESFSLTLDSSNSIIFLPDRIYLFSSNTYSRFEYSSLSACSGTTRFIETEGVPSDSKVVDHTWQYTNKTGGPDKRFANNKQIPIVQYGTITLRLENTNLSFEFHVSNVNSCDAFVSAIQHWKGKAGRNSSKTINAPCAIVNASPAPQKPQERNVDDDKSLTVEQIEKKIRKSLNGLIGIDHLAKNLAIDLNGFLNSEHSEIQILWGNSGTGKTELAQRLSGLKSGIPP
jgi:hypothetical protein